MDIIEEIDKYLETKEKQSKPRDYFYVSEITKSKKEIWNSIKAINNNKTEPRLKRIFENGDYMHMRYYKYFAEMGILRAAEVMAVENDLFHGRADCILSGRDGKLWLVDLKSCSQWTFNKLQEPDNSHRLQLLFYMYYMNIENGFILYENKDNQHIKVFKIFLTNENKIEVENIIDKFKEFKKEIENNIEPNEENKTPIILIKPKMEELQYGI